MLAAYASAVAAQSPDRLYELMRPLWQPQPKNFIRDWLICGEFPNPPHPGQKVYDHTPPCVGFETDYLTEQGGEARIRPKAGMKHTRPDGTVAEWKPYTSDQDIVDLNKAFGGGTHDNALAYAFITLTVPRPMRQYLAIGSDDGVRVWVNGKLVHDHLLPRGIAPDQDLVLVDFRKGENTLLFKVENGGGLWALCCRVLEESAFAGVSGPFEPKVEDHPNRGLLAVRTDDIVAFGPGQAVETTVEVVSPGGWVVARTKVAQGRPVFLRTAEWPDGPYEIRCIRDAGFGQRRVRHFPWFKGDGNAAVARLVNSLKDADPATPEGMVHALLVELVRDRLGGNLSNVDRARALTINSELMEFGELYAFREHQRRRKGAAQDLTDVTAAEAVTYLEAVEASARGEARSKASVQRGADRPYGFVRLAYRDEVDGSPQFCRAYLPPDYDPTRGWPLVINLHGRNPDNPPYTKWENVDLRHHPWADRYNVIVLEPHARHNSWYKGLGEKDVLLCLDLAKRRFSVDEDRVYLTGSSMGGSGVWEIGTRHPELFAALAPVFGGWDDRIFVDNNTLSRLTPRQRFEAETYSSFAQAESLLTTPVFINHGTKDDLVDVNHARLVVGMLQRWGYEVEYWEHLDKGHDVAQLGHEQTTLDWLLRHRRVRSPRHVRLRAPDLKSASAHWVRVENRENPLSFIQVDAQMVAPNFVRLSTDNVLAVTLSPGPELVNPAQPLKVDWNGEGAPAMKLVDGKLTLYAPGYSPGPLAKGPTREGPLRDVMTTPFAVILGTANQDPRRRAFCERQANRIVEEWQEEQHCRPRFFRDTELRDEDLFRYSLILVGGPEDNAVTGELIDKLPLRLWGDTIVLDGKEFKAPDSQVRLIYPHPLNPQRYVALTAATSTDAMYYAAYSRDPLGFRLLDAVDFYITDGRAPDLEAGRPDEKVCLASGFFDHDWRYSNAFTVLGDAGARSQSPKEKAPLYVNVAVEAETLYLSDVLEATTSGGFDDMARDLSFTRKPLELGGKQYEKGLGVGVWRMWEVKGTAAEWDISGGGWRRLRGVVGLQLRKDPNQLTQKRKDNTKVRFLIRGDGREVLKTDQLLWNSPPAEVEVSVEGVKRLRLEVVNEGQPDSAAESANWVNLRLEKL